MINPVKYFEHERHYSNEDIIIIVIELSGADLVSSILT